MIIAVIDDMGGGTGIHTVTQLRSRIKLAP